MTLLIRENGRIGVDWRAVAALVGLIVLAVSFIGTAVVERYEFRRHMREGDAALAEWRQHRENIGPWKHLDEKLWRELPYTLRNIEDDVKAIKKKMRIKDEDVRIGADYTMDDDPP